MAVSVRALQPAVTRVFIEGSPHRPGLDLLLKLSDQPSLSRCLPVDRVLKSLHKPLEMLEARFEGIDSRRVRTLGRASHGLLRIRAHAAELPDPGNQTFALVHVIARA